MSALFSGPVPRVRAAPASAPFLDLLARAMADALYKQDDPFALSDALVLVPNQRAARGLMDAFARTLGGAALLPAIRPLGDPHVDDDPDVWGAEVVGEDIAPPIDRLRRRLELASLIRRRDKAEHGVEDPVRALALADELARLLDSAATVEQVPWNKLRDLVTDFALARHWESSAAFLDIVAHFWPLHLNERGLSDVSAHGAAIRSALAARWEKAPPQRPVIIAGSTGSIATTRALMRVVARLPKGVVILPGLDTDLDDGAWNEIGDQHPQFALKQTLAALGLERNEALLFGEDERPARRILIREALAPAIKTADWLARLNAAGGAAFVAEGASGLTLLEAATEDEEALAIALLMRQALETPERSVALVTPDAGLSRRVEAKLARWGVAASVSHGRPLRETEAGALIALLCDLALDNGEPVALAALLKHPRVRLASLMVRTFIEHEALRGPRCYDTLAELGAALGAVKTPDQARAQTKADACACIASLAEILAPIANLRGAISLNHFADAVYAVAERLTDDRAFFGADGESAHTMLREAIDEGEALGPMDAHAAPRVLRQLMQGRQTAPPAIDQARAAIWGPLEARLQRRDLMILGGLNEGVWPQAAPEDPFLSRPMRAALGLPSHDQRIGLAAHDFAQLISGPEVVLTRSLRREGAPTLASRWLWRLKTLVQGAKAHLAEAPHVLAYARALDSPSRQLAPKAPRPTQGKLKQISVTQVETLIRDPYAVYARRILGLERLDPIGMTPGAAERGTAVHAAIERFGDGDCHETLLLLLDEELKRHGIAPERRAAERERMALSVATLIEWFASRTAMGVAVHRERYGLLDLGETKLTGVADRIEIGAGHAAIWDFKTGAPASPKQVQSGLAPQLPLEAAMLKRGVFKDTPAARATELGYWRFGGAEPTPKALELDAEGEGEKALKNLENLLKRYAEPDQPFLSKPRVQFIKPYDDYDHLARRKEWADAEGGDE